MKQWFLILLIIVAWGCSPQKKNQLPQQFRKLKNLTAYSTNAKPGETISFKKDAVYGDSNKVLIGRMGDLAVDDSGRVFIADVQKQLIYVFEPDGRFIAQLGREGKGPSEFSNIRSLQIRKDRLYVYDPSQYKVSVFTLDTLVGDNTIFLARNRGNYQALERAYPWIHKIYVRNNSTYLAEFISDSSKQTKKWQNVEMKGLFYLLDDNGMIASKLFEFTSETRTKLEAFVFLVKPFFGNSLTVLSSDNSIYRAGPDHLLIKVYSPNGAYRRAFYYPHKKIPLTRESAIEAEVPDLHIRNMHSMDLPRTWPVLTDMKIDDQNRLWIATTVRNMKVYQWWILNLNGQLIARFNWPRSKPIQVIKNGYLYTRETDEMGVASIVRYRIEMEPGEK